MSYQERRKNLPGSVSRDERQKYQDGTCCFFTMLMILFILCIIGAALLLNKPGGMCEYGIFTYFCGLIP